VIPELRLGAAQQPSESKEGKNLSNFKPVDGALPILSILTNKNRGEIESNSSLCEKGLTTKQIIKK
jgi:hypothetical protein